MAYSSPRPCTKFGCKKLVRGGGRCEEHEAELKKELESQRLSRHERGYDSRWVAARKEFLEEFPWCAECLATEGKQVAATDVDHIVPHHGNQELFWDRTNWQSLCHSHHSAKTAREDGRWAPRAW